MALEQLRREVEDYVNGGGAIGPDVSLSDIVDAGTLYAVCEAADRQFNFVFGTSGVLLEAIWRGAPGNYTFVRFSTSGSFSGGGAGFSATRYTHEGSGSRTYSFSGSAVFSWQEVGLRRSSIYAAISEGRFPASD